MHLLNTPWLVPLFPLLSFLGIGLILGPFSGRKSLSGWVGTFSILASAVCAYRIAFEYFSLPQAFVPWSFEWMRFQPGLSVHFGALIDPISVLLIVIVTTVSCLVHLYSIAYMREEEGFARYFTYLSLFTFSMLGLVLAPNILQMYVFWELVGASSFLLIGFYYERPSAVAASRKAFIVTRFADLGFLIGILVLAFFGYQIHASGVGPSLAQPFDFAFLTHPDVLSKLASHGVLSLALILLFAGAAGKSAMFPLHIWLPDAMEGPTPVSALIHAATMVVAGVYLVARMFPAYAASPVALHVVADIGLFTCLFAAVIACTQDDIKRVLAFSTLSQLGYMMFALGVATLDEPLGYTASMFHLFTHACFKALLFLGAGAIIHAVHSNDVWKMGGLAKKMPITHLTFLVAVLAISGVWPFSGFFSKDQILDAALEAHRMLHFYVGLAVAGVTAFYMARIYFLAFWGEARSEGASHSHEAPLLMLIPLLILGFFSITAGFVPFGKFVFIGKLLPSRGIDLAIAVPATLVGLSGLLGSWFLYGSGKKERSDRLSHGLGAFYRVTKNKFYVDELYLFVTRSILFKRVAAPIAWFDRTVVDGGVNLTGRIVRASSSALALLQTGQVQSYGTWFVGGAVLAAVLYRWMAG